MTPEELEQEILRLISTKPSSKSEPPTATAKTAALAQPTIAPKSPPTPVPVPAESQYSASHTYYTHYDAIPFGTKRRSLFKLTKGFLKHSVSFNHELNVDFSGNGTASIDFTEQCLTQTGGFFTLNISLTSQIIANLAKPAKVLASVEMYRYRPVEFHCQFTDQGQRTCLCMECVLRRIAYDHPSTTWQITETN